MDWTPLPPRCGGRATLVVPVYNQLHYTQACFESLRHSTAWPYDVVVVDNASQDGTGEYLASLEAQHWPLQVITNERNLGFTLATNQGMRAAQGDYVV